jgi:HPt (histidine-containing phosphotransfer) domain-containing protein
MIQIVHHTADPVGLDRALLEQMLDMGGSDLRPALVAQLLADFSRLSAALEGETVADLERAAHELKGLSGTIGAAGLSDSAARFGDLAGAATVAVRAAMALGLRRQIESLCAILRAEAPSAA